MRHACSQRLLRLSMLLLLVMRTTGSILLATTADAHVAAIVALLRSTCGWLMSSSQASVLYALNTCTQQQV
jgi:hypothetical protein